MLLLTKAMISGYNIIGSLRMFCFNEDQGRQLERERESGKRNRQNNASFIVEEREREKRQQGVFIPMVT